MPPAFYFLHNKTKEQALNTLRTSLQDVQHGIAMSLLALILGGLWAAYMATHHEQLHGGFEQQERALKQTAMQDMDMSGMSIETPPTAQGSTHHHAAGAHHHDAEGEGGAHHHSAGADVHHQHSHSGSLAQDAMQRLLRGHIHFMGIGLLAGLMMVLVAATTLRPCWKKTFGWTFGLGSLLYPPAWILMGFRTVALGPEAAEQSVLWLFAPAVALLVGSLVALLLVIGLEYCGFNKRGVFSWAFD